MANTATITADIGPGVTNTEEVYSNVSSAGFDFVAQTLKIIDSGNTKIYDIATATTITLTVADGVYELTVE